MEVLAAVAVSIAYLLAVNLADLAIQSAAWMGIVYVFVPLVLLPLFVYIGCIAFTYERNVARFRRSLKEAGFTTTHELPLVCLDDNAGRLACYEHLRTAEVRHWILDRKQIRGISVVKDGKTISTTSTRSLVGRSFRSGVVLGDVGAILSRLTARSQTSDPLKKLVLEVALECSTHPVHRIVYVDVRAGLGIGAESAKRAIERLEFAHALLEFFAMGEPLPAATSMHDLQEMIRGFRNQQTAFSGHLRLAAEGR